MKIAKQFVGDTMWVILSLIAIMHTLAFFVRDTGFEFPVFILFGVFTLIMAWRSPINGLLIAFTEIFIGGHGHLLDVEVLGFSLSIRILIFLIVMSVWLIRYVKVPLLFKEGLGVVINKFNPIRDTPWLILIVAVLIATVIGFTQNNPSAAFDDMNAFVVIGYLLPILSIQWNQKNKRQLLQVLFASTVWVIGLSIVLAYAFSHLDGKSLHALYTFVRDSRLAEVTLQVIQNDGSLLNSLLMKVGVAEGDFWYRIFMPAQTVVVFGVLLMYSAMTFLWRKDRLPWFAIIGFGLSTMIVLLSLSRSFVLGVAAGGLLIFISSWFFGKGKLRIVSRTVIGVMLSIISIITIFGVVQIPVPTRPDLSDAAFYETSAETGRSEAVVSRWNLLDPMMDEIYDNPIVGSGFGEEVTYQSEDPRVLEQEDGGAYTTYRFEWGWHDIWLKMGFLGLIGFIWYIVSLLRVGWFTAQNKGHKWLVAGLIAGIIAIFVTHTFSPYLNHPIGLGFMLFVIPFVDWNGFEKRRKEKLVETRSNRKLIKQPTPAVTSNID